VIVASNKKWYTISKIYNRGTTMRQIALLRGINVGGRNVIKMDELTKLLTSIGLNEVESYIQSGNIVFESDATSEDNAALIAQTLEQKYGFPVPTIVLTQKQLESALNFNPFEGDEFKPSYLLFYFLSGPAKCNQIDAVSSVTTQGERVEYINDVIYAYYPQGSGKSKLTIKFIESKLGVAVTGRNLTTIEKLSVMAQ
jgi:uncharacterized protein (DUF1697 family)